jgi:hypothetical protein
MNIRVYVQWIFLVTYLEVRNKQQEDAYKRPRGINNEKCAKAIFRGHGKGGNS